MYVCTGSLMGHGATESEERNTVHRKEAAEPLAFGAVRINGDIDPVAVIESHGAMYGGFAVCANG